MTVASDLLLVPSARCDPYGDRCFQVLCMNDERHNDRLQWQYLQE